MGFWHNCITVVLGHHVKREIAYQDHNSIRIIEEHVFDNRPMELTDNYYMAVIYVSLSPWILWHIDIKFTNGTTVIYYSTLVETLFTHPVNESNELHFNICLQTNTHTQKTTELRNFFNVLVQTVKKILMYGRLAL